jgi:hypothetical protein
MAKERFEGIKVRQNTRQKSGDLPGKTPGRIRVIYQAEHQAEIRILAGVLPAF